MTSIDLKWTHQILKTPNWLSTNTNWSTKKLLMMSKNCKNRNALDQQKRDILAPSSLELLIVSEWSCLLVDPNTISQSWSRVVCSAESNCFLYGRKRCGCNVGILLLNRQWWRQTLQKWCPRSDASGFHSGYGMETLETRCCNPIETHWCRRP